MSEKEKRLLDDGKRKIIDAFEKWIWSLKRFKHFRSEVENLVKELKGAYPDLEPEILEAVLSSVVEGLFSSVQYDFWSSIYNHLSKEGYFPCNPSDCSSCGQSCKKVKENE